MVGEFQLPWGMLAAGGVVSILPVIALFILARNVILAGGSTGASSW